MAGFTALVLVSLVAAFMNQQLLSQAEKESLGDPLSVAYLANLLRTDPDNLEVRMRLAESQVYLGQLAGVDDLIAPALRSRDPEWKTRGRLLEYKYVTKQYELSDPETESRAELVKRRRRILAQLAARPLPLATTVYLAGEAVKLHEHGVAVALYRRITDSPHVSPAWCASMAVQALASRDYQSAAFLYFTARERENSVAMQREYLIEGIRTLMADNLFTQAMQAADQHLGSLSNDAETLRFLIKAARAANDQDRAARYARQLLQVSWLERAERWWRRLDLGLIQSAEAAPLAPEAKKPALRHYDSEKYKLAYDVFLEDRKLNDAFAVAETAVRESPGDAGWHQRLARVAEWVNKPQIAEREWLWLMRHNGGETALLAVLRIAPQLDDYDAALEAWTYMADRQTLNDDQWRTMVDLYEKTGRQADGIKYLEARYEASHTPRFLEMAASLAERNGEDEHAQRLYLRLLKHHGFNPEWVQNAANVYLKKGKYKQAYELLQKNIKHASKKDSAYWSMLADLAWQLQDDANAVKDYKSLAAAGNLTAEGYRHLLALLGDSHPEEAGNLAELGYKKYGDRSMLLRALESYAATRDLVAEKRLLDSAAADPKSGVLGDAHFILARARYLQAIGAYQAARANYQRAMAIAPNDQDTLIATLWAMVEGRDQTDLRELITRITARGDQNNPAYWGALAAAYEVLDQPSRAVAYYSRHLKQHGQDFLWLVNYAEALDRAGQAGLALRVRRHAWAQLRTKLGEARPGARYSPDMLAAARLEVVNQPGDPSLTLVRSVLRQDRLVKKDVVADPRVNELVLGWALSTEQEANAKTWLWQRYGQALERPLWADAVIATRENDTERLAQMLEQRPEALPPSSRYEAASALGQTSYAQSIAFETLASDPDNAEAYANFARDALTTASHADFEIRDQKFGTLHEAVQNIKLDTALSDTLRMGVELQHIRQSDSTPPPLSPFPSTERLAGISFRKLSSLGETEASLRRVEQFAGFNELKASHTKSMQNLTVKLAAEANAETDESNSLRVFGMRNAVSATVDYAFHNRAYLSLHPLYAKYYTQQNVALGIGRELSWEVGQHISASYPALRIAVIGINEGFNTAQSAPFALPNNQNLYGGCVGFAEERSVTYSRSWHPYFDACGTHNNVAGKGYIAKLGLAGPVAGHDRLGLSLDQEQGGVKVVNGLQRIITCNYRYFFD